MGRFFEYLGFSDVSSCVTELLLGAITGSPKRPKLMAMGQKPIRLGDESKQHTELSKGLRGIPVRF